MVITIARSYGSGGRVMAYKLAELLGIKAYDRELIRMVSDETGIAENMFGLSDEALTGRKGLKFNAENLEPLPPSNKKYTSEDNLFRLEAQMIRRLSDEQDCIIIGRCADFILKDKEDVFKLYCYASIEDCIARTKQVCGLAEEDDAKILKKINSIDSHRADYYKYYTGSEWTDARHYDLCLNTGSRSIEELAELVKDYIEKWYRR